MKGRDTKMGNNKWSVFYREHSNQVWHMFHQVLEVWEKVNGAEESMMKNLLNVMKDFNRHIFKKPNKFQTR